MFSTVRVADDNSVPRGLQENREGTMLLRISGIIKDLNQEECNR